MFATGGSPREEAEERDFILRLIRQVIRAVAAAGNVAAAKVEIESAYKELDVDLVSLRCLDAGVVAKLAREKGIHRELAELMRAEAQLTGDERLLARAARVELG